MTKNGITPDDNEKRDKAVEAVNGAAARMQLAKERLHRAESELGTARNEYRTAENEYNAARSRLMKLIPRVDGITGKVVVEEVQADA